MTNIIGSAGKHFHQKTIGRQHRIAIEVNERIHQRGLDQLASMRIGLVLRHGQVVRSTENDHGLSFCDQRRYHRSECGIGIGQGRPRTNCTHIGQCQIGVPVKETVELTTNGIGTKCLMLVDTRPTMIGASYKNQLRFVELGKFLFVGLYTVTDLSFFISLVLRKNRFIDRDQKIANTKMI